MDAIRCPYKNATVEQYSEDFLPVNVRYAKVRERLPYEKLLVQDNGDGSSTLLSDVDLLFNQERLDRMSLQALQARLDEQVKAGNTGLSELRKNVSDADLHKFIKSRYIQSLSELQQWTNYLSRSEKGLVSSIRDSIAVKDTGLDANPAVPVGSAPASAAE